MGFRQEDVDWLLVATGRRCCICQERHSVSVHHIVSLADGGTDETDNGIPLCPNCHNSVHSRGPGQVVRHYTATELKLHRQRTIEMVSPKAHTAAPTATSILKDVSDPSAPLSRCCVEGIQLARSIGNADLEQFCRDELQGYTRLQANLIVPLGAEENRRISHRVVDAYVCIRGFIEPQTMEIVGGRLLMRQIKGDPEAFKPMRMLYPEPLAALEVQAPHGSQDALIIINLNIGDFVEGVPKEPRHLRGCYMAGDTQQTVLRSIRTEFTNRLLAFA